MARNKLKKLNEVRSFNNVFERDQKNLEEAIREYFGNDKPYTLEIGCGRGDYTINLAKLHPERNFIGIDVKGARIWNGSQTAEEEGLSNAAFLLTGAEQLDEHFSKKSVEEIWITFPDPYSKKKRANKRLVSPFFLNIYKKILTKGAKINLKTDDEGLYDYAFESISSLEDEWKILFASNNIYEMGCMTDELNIKTKYETKHIANGKYIKIVRFGLNNEVVNPSLRNID